MAKFNEYTAKATPEDADTLMLYDAASKANKLSPFSGIWNWMVNKLTNAVINNLQTSNKTVVGALNELNSKTWDSVGSYDIPANDTGITVQIPSNAKEILLFVGSKNDQQVYGGKSYIICATPLNIVYEKEIFSAAGNSIGSGFYAYYNDNTLTMKCKTSSNTVAAHVYIK